MIVPEVTTLRRHLEAQHSAKYRTWAKAANFESKLPGDIKKRKEAREQVTRTLDRDLKEKKLSERVIPYSYKGFIQAAIEWLVATDQPVKALDHPKFKEMIDVASRATSSISIPGRKATRTEIKRMFVRHLTKLKARLNVITDLFFTAC
ncbi:hypothetical protein BJV77DRAFT_950382 [Russula vinacea]|nr:hypothetical protein BJV77DRAFT_950382 [Russula vinacea]